MAIVVGKIQPLKKLKKELSDNVINRFNSIGEINSFKRNYESERAEVFKITKVKLDQEILNLQKTKSDVIKKSNKNFITKAIHYFEIRRVSKKISNLKKNYEKILSKRVDDGYAHLSFTKEVVDRLYPVIAGAVGENQTVKEIEKLSDDFYLINDLSLKFDPPIYYKKEKDRIYTVQIDHLLICKSGVFLLETKNWSYKSINDLDLRSPVKQITITSFALFIFLNSESNISSVKRHWGNVKIPIRNIIVMTKFKPKEEFRHVKVLTLNELNSYIEYFDEIFTSEEVKHMFNFFSGTK